MLKIFNRRELVVVTSAEKLFRIREALAANGIECWSKVPGGWGAASARDRGFAGLNVTAHAVYNIYVHKNDYDRANAVLQEVLRSL